MVQGQRTAGVEAAEAERVSVLCVEDNLYVAEAIRMKFDRVGGFEWKGWLSSADNMVSMVEQQHPRVLILDVDMPGRNPFEALRELGERCPSCRTVVFSGHVRHGLVEQALDAGAWGYVSKNDGEDALISAIRDIVAGELALSPEVRASYGRGNAL